MPLMCSLSPASLLHALVSEDMLLPGRPSARSSEEPVLLTMSIPRPDAIIAATEESSVAPAVALLPPPTTTVPPSASVPTASSPPSSDRGEEEEIESTIPASSASGGEEEDDPEEVSSQSSSSNSSSQAPAPVMMTPVRTTRPSPPPRRGVTFLARDAKRSRRCMEGDEEVPVIALSSSSSRSSTSPRPIVAGPPPIRDTSPCGTCFFFAQQVTRVFRAMLANGIRAGRLTLPEDVTLPFPVCDTLPDLMFLMSLWGWTMAQMENLPSDFASHECSKSGSWPQLVDFDISDIVRRTLEQVYDLGAASEAVGIWLSREALSYALWQELFDAAVAEVSRGTSCSHDGAAFKVSAGWKVRAPVGRSTTTPLSS